MNILVSIGIFALLSALTIPYLRKYQTGMKLNGVAKNLTSDLRLAQQLTITEQATHLVDMDMIANSYSLLKITPATTTIKTVTLPSDVRFDDISAALSDRVIFNSFGGVSQSGQITLANTEDTTSIINVKPSGYIELIQ